MNIRKLIKLTLFIGIFTLCGTGAKAQFVETDTLDLGSDTVALDLNDFSTLLELANDGNDMAMVKVALAYQTGEGVEKDYREMIKWIGKAADKGNVDACYYIGVFYRDGIGLPKNDTEAAYWFRKAARNGNPEAMLNIGHCFKYGKGVLPDDKIASEYYWRSGKYGVIEGKYCYACCLRDGVGAKQDKKLAMEWFQQCADCNYLDSASQVEALKQELEAEKKTSTTSKKSKK